MFIQVLATALGTYSFLFPAYGCASRTEWYALCTVSPVMYIVPFTVNIEIVGKMYGAYTTIRHAKYYKPYVIESVTEWTKESDSKPDRL